MTTTRTTTVREVLSSGNANKIPDAMQKIKVGNQLSKIKVTFAALTSAAAQDITTAAAKAAATILGISLQTGELLPAIGSVVTLRVTAGTLAAGPALVTDAGGTATAIGALSNHVVLLSDDGKTLTFQAAVTGFVLEYYPAPAGGADQAYAYTAP